MQYVSVDRYDKSVGKTVTCIPYNIINTPFIYFVSYQFKILLLTYKTIHGSAPSYLSELVSSSTPSRSLRSSSKNLLCRRKTKLLQYGGRSFFQCSAKAVERTPGFSAEVRIPRCLQKRLEEASFL